MSPSSEMQIVVVADDIPANAELLEVMAKKALVDAHVRVESCTGENVSEDVLNMIHKFGKNICLLLTDIEMPSASNGLEVIEEAYEYHIPIFAVSGRLDHLINGHREMCAQVFEKPIRDMVAFRVAIRDAVTNGHDSNDQI